MNIIRRDPKAKAADDVAVRSAANEGSLAMLRSCQALVVREAERAKHYDFATDIDAAFDDLARELP